MAFTRKNVWELGSDWAGPILWYARGVAAMKSRPLAELTSWRFYAAIHGIREALWRSLGHLRNGDTTPTNVLTKKFWNQCQHGTWYFLPWHRGYLLAFEEVVRDAIVKLGGPADWSLPYWNYFKPGQFKLPPAFSSPDWPDGQGNNPLYEQQRYGPNDDGKVFVPVDQVDMNELGDADFSGPGGGGSPGFGGVDTGFAHGGDTHGGIETQPHDWVHGLVGGGTRQQPGLMSNPDTAALDAIFWLHHANIDRLWVIWVANPASHGNPTDAKWKQGPASIGDRGFSMPLPGGTWDYTPGDMEDPGKLGQYSYDYDDVVPTGAEEAVVARLMQLGAPAGIAKGASKMAAKKNVELMGATQQGLRVIGSGARAQVKLDREVRQKVAASLATAPQPEEPAVPDRVFLNLENVRGLSDATAFKVYVNLPEGADPEKYPELLAGKIALFGVTNATAPDAEHAGRGLTYPLEITRIVDALHLRNALDVDSLHVTIVPIKPVPEDAQISIERVSLFRQGK